MSTIKKQSYTKLGMQKFLNQFKIVDSIVIIHYSDFGFNCKPSLEYWKWIIIPGIYMYAEREGIEIELTLLYTDSVKIKIGDKKMSPLKKEYCVKIPYKKYDEYVEFVRDVNGAVSEHGQVQLFVSNVPYFLKARLYIECSEEESINIRSFIAFYGLKVDTTRGFEELFSELADRKWNLFGFTPNMDPGLEYLSAFTFAPQSALKQQGYNFDTIRTKKQVFISYAHVNNDVVNHLVKEMREYGINVWFDKYSIDYGEKILEAIMTGLGKSDYAVFFLSRAFQESMVGNHELSTFWMRVVRNQKKWIIVRLDDVNPDDIFEGLGDYKYYDYNGNSEELAKIIRETFELK